MEINSKVPRTIVMANNWKNKEIATVIGLRDEMVTHNIDEKLIKKYLDEEYDRINTQYELRIKKYHDKLEKNLNNNDNKSIKKSREKAIDFIIKNKMFLEEKGYNKEYIDKYVNKHYMIINEKYKTNDNTSMEGIDFIE